MASTRGPVWPVKLHSYKSHGVLSFSFMVLVVLYEVLVDDQPYAPSEFANAFVVPTVDSTREVFLFDIMQHLSAVAFRCPQLSVHAHYSYYVLFNEDLLYLSSPSSVVPVSPDQCGKLCQMKVRCYVLLRVTAQINTHFSSNAVQSLWTSTICAAPPVLSALRQVATSAVLRGRLPQDQGVRSPDIPGLRKNSPHCIW